MIEIDFDGPSDRLRRLAEATARLTILEAREAQSNPDGGLFEFVRYFWDVLEPHTPFVDGMALRAICAHLEAVTRGEIKRLLINVPPGFCKSLLCNVFWPAWEWTAMGMSHLRYVTFSYAAHLTERDNGKFRDLLSSRKMQEAWGHAFQLTEDGKVRVANSSTGWKFASSVRGVGTGERGNRVILDDPHNVKEGESEAVRSETVRWVREGMSNRLNDMETGVIICIMQRVHQLDVSGALIEDDLGYVHLCIPMEYAADPARHCRTPIGWEDWRTEVNELAWPERFSRAVTDMLKRTLGPYAYAGQYMQTPEARGGGIIKREWWQLWEADKFPQCEYRWAAADTAYTEKEENDPTGFTVWGLFYEKGDPKVIMLNAWRKRLEIHGPTKWTETNTKEERKAQVMEWRRIAQAYFKQHGSPEPNVTPNRDPWLNYIETGDNTSDRWPNEITPVWEARTQQHWGLCEWLAHSCRRFKVHRLLVEGKASGLSVAQELRRLHGGEGWAIQTTTPEGDKMARLYAVQPVFSAGMVYSPDRDWAQLAVDECAVFPKGTHDDLADSTSMALKHVRDLGMLLRPTERALMDEIDAMHSRKAAKSAPLYPGAG